VALSVVEMAGMVGAGKTTLAAAVTAALEDRGYRVLRPAVAIDEVLDRSLVGMAARLLVRSPTARRRVQRAVYRLVLRPCHMAWFVAGRARPTATAVGAVWRSPLPGWHRRKIVGLLLRSAATQLYLVRRMRSDEVLLIDEGLVHRAVNLFAWTDGDVDLAAVAHYVTSLPPTDLLVLVTAPLLVCVERADARGLPRRLVGHDDATVARFMTNAAAVVDALPELLRAGCQPWVRVDNGGMRGDAVAALRVAVGAAVEARAKADACRAGWTASAREVTAGTPRFGGGLHVPRPDVRRAGGRRPPRISSGDVADLLAAFALRAVGSAASISSSSRADNVVVSTTDGRKVLKRYKASVAAASIVHEHSILRHLARLNFPAPRLVPAADGATARQIDGRWYAVFDYLPGYLHYHEHLWSPRTYRTLVGLSGEALGALHEALHGFTPEGTNPSGFTAVDGIRHRDLGWYLECLDRARACADGSGDHAFRALLDHAAGPVAHQLRVLDEDLAAAELPRQTIHGDYGPYNLLFRSGERIVVLDFELARIDWRVVDVAKSLQQFGITRRGLRLPRIAAFVAAYDRRQPLEPAERRLLPDVWRFLSLRRVPVCWDRYTVSRDARWLVEARRKLALAELIRSHATLSALERVGGTRWRR